MTKFNTSPHGRILCLHQDQDQDQETVESYLFFCGMLISLNMCVFLCIYLYVFMCECVCVCTCHRVCRTTQMSVLTFYLVFWGSHVCWSLHKATWAANFGVWQGLGSSCLHLSSCCRSSRFIAPSGLLDVMCVCFLMCVLGTWNPHTKLLNLPIISAGHLACS